MLSAEVSVVTYKSRSQVEQAFRSMKGMDIRIRPIRHFTEWLPWSGICGGRWARCCTTIRTWTWSAGCGIRVKPAKGFRSAAEKKKTAETIDGFAVHSFETMLVELTMLCRHTCSTPGSQGMTFTMETEMTPLQAMAVQCIYPAQLAGCPWNFGLSKNSLPA